MPLFGNKRNRSAERAAAREHNTDHTTAARTGAGAGTGIGAGAGDTGPGYGNSATGHNNTGYNNSSGHTGAGYDTQPNMSAQQPGYGSGMNNQSADPYSNTVNANDPTMAPTNHFNDGQRSGGGSRLAGKMEHAVGSVVGSQALKNKGMQKEQESQAFKAQSAEIGEAERLEREAMLRRERAVQHGAHPENKQLGGAMNAQSYGNNFDNMGAGGGHGNGAGVGPTGPQSSARPM